MFKPTLLSLIACVILGLVTGCAVSYQAAEEGVSGYRDLQIDKDTFYVEYTETTRVSWEQLHAFALKRCAELTRNYGYSVFDVLEKDEKTVYLKSGVDKVTISSMGNIANEPPVSHSYVAGGRVEGRRVTYKIKMIKE